MSGRNHMRPLSTPDHPPSVASFLRNARTGDSFPLPGKGETAKRLQLLRKQAAADASVGRLVEAHADAVAILVEAGVAIPPAMAFAVWASGRPETAALEQAGDTLVLNGVRTFCGGASIVDAALIIASSADGEQLVLVDLRQPGIRIDSSLWKSDAFRDAAIGTVHFTDVRVRADCLIGSPGWYGSRPGFWFGAVGVAALWAGLADSILALLPQLRRYRDETSCVATGSIEASMWAVSALLEQAGHQIDRAASNSSGDAKLIALSCRHNVRSLLESAISLFDQEVGPAATAFDANIAIRRAELSMALAQSHGVRDLVEITRP